MRSALVRTEQLAEFARQLDLGRAMRLGRGETAAGGRGRDVLLCATFEAVIGALYLQRDITSVQIFVHPLLEGAVEQLMFRPDIHDSKSRLQEWSQANKYGLPHYFTVQASGPEHERQFEVEVRINEQVYGRGVGSSKALAARAAAQAAMERIDGEQDT